ncbi:MAG: ribosome-associated translation inhibitor RaiA [Patescibacteria group bacterium]
MQINLKGTNIELTPSIKDYVLKKVTNLEKLLKKIEEKQGKIYVNFEVGKSTLHHNKGEVFHTDCLINLNGEEFYASSDKEDLYVAIDEIKEILFNKINKNKDKKQTLFRRGAISIKKMLKGLSKRNPFTSKY